MKCEECKKLMTDYWGAGSISHVYIDDIEKHLRLFPNHAGYMREIHNECLIRTIVEMSKNESLDS